MNEHEAVIAQQSLTALRTWLQLCTRKGGISRNTIAVGIVVLDRLREMCPVSRGDILSKGGEVKGARSGLKVFLEKYEIPPAYLKEATGRQVAPDALNLLEALQWGQELAAMSPESRDETLKNMIGVLTAHAQDWLVRRNLELVIDRRNAPTSWVNLILDQSKTRSGGVVEQHLVGAKLARRFQDIDVPNYPAHAADVQTERLGDFQLHDTVYHVTATPSRNVIEKCAANIKMGKMAILLVPSNQVYKAVALAEDVRISQQLAIISIESFVALNVIEMAMDEKKDSFTVLKEIIAIYNQRLKDVETDLSLMIEIS